MLAPFSLGVTHLLKNISLNDPVGADNCLQIITRSDLSRRIHHKLKLYSQLRSTTPLEQPLPYDYHPQWPIVYRDENNPYL